MSTEVTNNQIEEQFITTTIQRFNKTDAGLEDLKNKWSGVKISDVNDTENYKLVSKGISELRTTRTGVEKTRKELKELPLRIGRRIDEEAKRITSIIEPLENSLIAEKTRIDDELEKIRKQKIAERLEKLQTLGFELLSGFWVLGKLSIENHRVEVYRDEEFETLLIAGEGEAKRVNQEKIDAENARLQKEEEDRIENERKEAERKAEEKRLADLAEENRKEQEKLDAQKKAQDEERRKFQEEKAAFEQKKSDARTKQLIDLGLKFDGESFVLEDINVHHTEQSMLSDSDWDKLISEITPIVKDRLEARKLVVENPVVEFFGNGQPVNPDIFNPDEFEDVDDSLPWERNEATDKKLDILVMDEPQASSETTEFENGFITAIDSVVRLSETYHFTKLTDFIDAVKNLQPERKQ